MRRNESLTVRQVEVLQWIGDGCLDGVWRDFTYKTTAYALASRGLVTVDRRRKQWSATLTDEGRFYLAHGHYPLDRDPIGNAHTAESGSETNDLASGLLAELVSAGGQVIVESPSEKQRARYRRAIHRLITEHRIPKGFVLRHTGRDHGDLTIRFLRENDTPRLQPPPKIAVPQTTGAVSDEVRGLASRVRVAVTEPTMERTLRILQAITDECAIRTWTLQPDPRDDRRFHISTAECSFEFGLREELVDRDMPDEDTLATSKYTWQRVPLHARKVGSGRLTLQLGEYYRTRSWSDRRSWTLDDKLGALFAELDARVTEAAEQRRQREEELLRRQQAWEAAVLAAQRAYVIDLNQRRLRDQVAEKGRAREYRDYAESLNGLIDDCDDPAIAESIRTWQHWTSQEAERIDPLTNPEVLRYVEPDHVTAEEFAPFMAKGMNAHHRPTK
ncbi:hypothetical protein [Mycolicibacterium sp. CR10]|uniref:hypothetical protein n=1 Tax=Mycolicibacterium sp. CR10 TaxID=2562314 RepID=UPI0010C09E6E|nr:hypothetical protein [Mycolicibacterium sp. CR10]